MAGFSFDPPLAQPGDERVLSPDNTPIPTADGWLSVTSNSDAQTGSLLRAIGREDLIEDQRFATVAARMRNIGEWYRMRNAAFGGKTTAAWLEILNEAGVPAMPCHSLETLMEDPHLTTAELLGRQDHPTEGAVRTIRSTIMVDGVARHDPGIAPPVGWDTEAVLLEAGFTASEITAFADSGAVVAAAKDREVLRAQGQPAG